MPWTSPAPSRPWTTSFERQIVFWSRSLRGRWRRKRPGGAVDTHCHLFLMEEDPGAAVSAARAAGVSRLVCVGIDPDSSRRSLELAESFRGVFATAGMHPHTASGFDRQAGSVVEELLADP